MTAYLVSWAGFLALCAGVLVARRKALAPQLAAYRPFLLTPWKVATATAAMLGMGLMAPFTGDPTWDWGTVTLMSVTTFLTAPWSLATLWRVLRRQASAWDAVPAVGLTLFSSSWCYDLYLLLRDGTYPTVWIDNLKASPIIYAFAGLFWNLEWRQGRGVHLAFTEEHWPPKPAAQAFRKVLWAAAAIMLLLTGLFAIFLR